MFLLSVSLVVPLCKVTSLITNYFNHRIAQRYTAFFDAFLPSTTKRFFIPPLSNEPAVIFDLPIYCFSPAFYLSRCSLLFEFVG